MVLVIGYGNATCGDDGVGPWVIEQLEAGDSPDGVETLTAFQLAPELAEPISRADVVIFVDAAVGDTPGRMHWGQVSMEPNGAFSHHVMPGRVLAMAGALYGARPLAFLYSVEGENFGLGDDFSDAVRAVLPEFLAHVRARIGKCIETMEECK